MFFISFEKNNIFWNLSKFSLCAVFLVALHAGIDIPPFGTSCCQASPGDIGISAPSGHRLDEYDYVIDWEPTHLTTVRVEGELLEVETSDYQMFEPRRDRYTQRIKDRGQATLSLEVVKIRNSNRRCILINRFHVSANHPALLNLEQDINLLTVNCASLQEARLRIAEILYFRLQQ